MRALLVTTASVLIAISVRAASPETIVNSFFPNDLKTTIAGDVPAADRLSAFTLADLNHDGTQLIVAVYSNGIRGAVSVLSSSGDGSLLASAAPAGMTGRRAAVSLVDLAHDGHSEILATMSSPRGYDVTWVYKWSGASLTLTGPVEYAGTDDYASDLVNPLLVAIDGDGTLSIVDQHYSRSCCDDDGSENASEELRLFHWVNGGLAQQGTLDCRLLFARGNGAPVAKSASFSVSTAGSREIIIVNGDYDGANRVASAYVTLNGQPILQPSALNEKVGFVRVNAPVTAGDNQFSVKLDGKPGGHLSLLVRPVP
jgi:hypothetical protein